MTTPERTGQRDILFSQWIRRNLPGSETGLWVTDLDFILFNKKHQKVMLLEIKCRNVAVKSWQHLVLNYLHKWISKGMVDDPGWEYMGLHLITFEKEPFENGKIYFDNKELTEEELIKKLSI